MKKTLCYCTIILLFTAGNVAANGSIQAFGSWWDSGDADTSYGGGLRGTIGKEIAIDIGWTYFTGDDITIDVGGKEETLDFGGLDSHVFDLGFRYTFPMEIYLGGGGSYYTFDSDIGSTDGKWGLYGLLGWSFGGEHFRGFVEGIYRYTEATVEFDTTDDYDISYDGIGANIGIMYRF
jgi:hypothetical protein